MTFSANRRKIIKTGVGLGLVTGFPLIRTSRAQSKVTKITVADPGGAYQAAFRKAFYDPFEKATGIRVVSAAREAEPTAQIQAMIQTRSYTWDASILTQSARDILLAQNMLEPLNLPASLLTSYLPDAHTPQWLGTDVYATVFAYRTDTYKKNPPQSWKDFWDVKRFPGRRGMSKSPIDTLEQALLADGVPADKLYPIDMDRAFKSLNKIKPHVAVWWAWGAQSAQIIQSGEVDMVAIWNGRAQAVIDGGAPVKIGWNQGIYAIEGWGILKGGPRIETVRKFVEFCADPHRQAVYTESLSYGPPNKAAYQYISKKRAEVLPSSPQNFQRMTPENSGWWTKNRAKAVERFNAWLLS
jgi:putative spermidine/putrescine transport system substrate-binding protein